MFCKVFYKEYFPRPFSAQHRHIFSLLDDPTKKRVVIAAPRGYGKSSIAAAYTIKCALFEEFRYIVPIGASEETAVEHTENVKDMILECDKITDVWPEMKSAVWAKNHWRLSNGVTVLPRGSGQKIRGRRRKAQRPDLIILDDVENDENVMQEEQRRKLKQWFLGAVCNSIDPYATNHKIVVIGTLLHEDSLLANLLEDSSWESVRLEICDDLFHSNWPEVFTDMQVRALYDTYASAGEQDVFAREYRNMPISATDSKFKKTYFKYYDTETTKFADLDILTVILGDPAKTHTVHSCESAWVGASINMRTQAIYIRDIVAGRMTPAEYLDSGIAMAERLQASTFGIEVTGLNEYIMWPLQNKIAEAGKFYNIIEIKPRDKKEVRAAALITPYRQGLIWHNKQACAGLEMALLSFPRSRYWDTIDATAHVLPVMEELKKYFWSPTMLCDKRELVEFEQLKRQSEGFLQEKKRSWRIA